MNHRRSSAFVIGGFALFLAACSASRSPSSSMLPGGVYGADARTRAGLVAVVPPANGSTYYYLYATTAAMQGTTLADTRPAVNAGGLVEAAWATTGAASTLTLSASPSPGLFQWQQAVPPFLQPGNYAFTAASGGLEESYSGYSYTSSGGNFKSIAQRQTNRPPAIVATFPLVARPSAAMHATTVAALKR